MVNLKKGEALWVTEKTNILYLSGFSGSNGTLLITAKNKHLLTDFRYLERAKKSVKRDTKVIEADKEKILELVKKGGIKTLKIDETNLTVKRFKDLKKLFTKSKIKFTDGSGVIESIREIKSKEELKKIVKSQRINEKVFNEIKKIIIAEAKKAKTNITEKFLAQEVGRLAEQYGAQGLAFDPIIAFGKNSSMPHYEPSSKCKLKKGDLVLIDMGVNFKGYLSDMTRVVFTAKPTQEQKKIYNLVLEAQENCLKNLKAGITGKKADALARDIIRKAGYGDFYGHAGGHGIGIYIHESPSLSEKYIGVLKEGSVVTVEPGIYLPGNFGIRIEDMALIKKNGIINLTKISKKI